MVSDMSMGRTGRLVLTVCLLAPVGSALASAQTWPTIKPITMVVAVPPGAARGQGGGRNWGHLCVARGPARVLE
jgi:hypothetical protein